MGRRIPDRAALRAKAAAPRAPTLRGCRRRRGLRVRYNRRRVCPARPTGRAAGPPRRGPCPSASPLIRSGRIAGIGSEAGAADAVHRADLVLVGGIAADPDRADDLTGGVTDQDTA